MCHLYLTEHGSVLGVSGGRFVVRYTDGREEEIPKNTISGISVMAKASLTPSCIQFCLTENVPVGFFSQSGTYYGCLSGIENKGIIRVKRQIELFEDEDFSRLLSSKIVHAKINNQMVVLKKYLCSRKNDNYNMFPMRNARRKVVSVIGENSKYKIKGYEGIAARNYFEIMSDIIPGEYRFKGREHPAKDPVNALLNLGYSVLTKEIYGYIEERGLNPYCGFLHENREGHAALVSDLIEEWRAPIVDTTVLSLMIGGNFPTELFSYNVDGICVLEQEGIRLFLGKLEQRMYTQTQYLSYIKKPLTFRESVWHQVEKISKAVITGRAETYKPVIIR